MRVLIQREMEGEVASNLKERIRYFFMYGMVLLILMWLLGPRMLDIFRAGEMNQFVSVMTVIIISSGINDKLENDSNNRQLIFLQTLPIQKSQLVHAKFLHMLWMWSIAFVWLSAVISANLLLNGSWTFESWTHVWKFTSALLFIETMSLLFYFLKGYQTVQAVFYLSALAWIAVFIPLGLTTEQTGLSKGQLWGLALLAAFTIVAIGWLMAVRKVKTNGFPEAPGSDYDSDENSN